MLKVNQVVIWCMRFHTGEVNSKFLLESFLLTLSEKQSLFRMLVHQHTKRAYWEGQKCGQKNRNIRTGSQKKYHAKTEG